MSFKKDSLNSTGQSKKEITEYSTSEEFSIISILFFGRHLVVKESGHGQGKDFESREV